MWSERKKNGSNIKKNVLLVVFAISCGLGFFYCNWNFLPIIGGTMVARVLELIRVTSFLCYFMFVLLASTRIIVETKFDVFFSLIPKIISQLMALRKDL